MPKSQILIQMVDKPNDKEKTILSTYETMLLKGHKIKIMAIIFCGLQLQVFVW